MVNNNTCVLVSWKSFWQWYQDLDDHKRKRPSCLENEYSACRSYVNHPGPMCDSPLQSCVRRLTYMDRKSCDLLWRTYVFLLDVLLRFNRVRNMVWKRMMWLGRTFTVQRPLDLVAGRQCSSYVYKRSWEIRRFSSRLCVHQLNPLLWENIPLVWIFFLMMVGSLLEMPDISSTELFLISRFHQNADKSMSPIFCRDPLWLISFLLD